jgi:heat-inducible transcriptional repressor
MEWQPLASEERRTIRHQFYQVRTDMEEWIRLAATMLSRLAQGAAMVSPPRAPRSRLKHLELLSVYETRVLLVLILQDGTIRQHMLTLDDAISQEELRRMANHMNEALSGLRAGQILRLAGEGWNTLEGEVIDLVASSMQQLDRGDWEDFVHGGVIEALSQPEFAEVERTRHFLEILEQGQLLSELLGQALSQTGVQIIIGGESRREEMRDYSLVASRYGLAGRMEGVLGVLGPTRMFYPRSVSAVHFIARMMGELLGQLHE